MTLYLSSVPPPHTQKKKKKEKKKEIRRHRPDEWINKMWYIYTVEYDSAIKGMK